MMKTVILVCALGIARPDCTIDNAVSVVQGPEASHLAQCGFLGQAYLASTSMANYLDGDHYLKILCTNGDRLDAQAKPTLNDQALAQAVD